MTYAFWQSRIIRTVKIASIIEEDQIKLNSKGIINHVDNIIDGGNANLNLILQPLELIALGQMQFKISQYEFKGFNSDDWQNVSEKLVLKKLVDAFDLITPSLSEMIQGNEIITPEGIFRLKNCGNEGKNY